jgi:hypothetical protein
LSGILASVLRTGERKSVASIGSHTTSTRSEGSALRCRSCSTAEAPRRQVDQVGESRSTSRGPSVDLSKAVSNAAKLEFVSVMRGSCPFGVEELMRRSATARSSPMRATPTASFFLFTSRLRRNDRR